MGSAGVKSWTASNDAARPDAAKTGTLRALLLKSTIKLLFRDSDCGLVRYCAYQQHFLTSYCCCY